MSDNSDSCESYSEDEVMGVSEDKATRRSKLPTTITLSTIFSQPSSSDGDGNTSIRNIPNEILNVASETPIGQRVSNDACYSSTIKSNLENKQIDISKPSTDYKIIRMNSEYTSDNSSPLSPNISNMVEDRSQCNNTDNRISINVSNIPSVKQHYNEKESNNISDLNIIGPQKSVNIQKTIQSPDINLTSAKSDDLNNIFDYDLQDILEFELSEVLEDSGYVGDTETPIKRKKRKRFISRGFILKYYNYNININI